MPVTIEDIRRSAVARSLFPPTTLRRALERFGFVQADPIRAPARAQDLTLRHRVKDYRVGDLDRKYARLGVAEDVFVNYGFVTHGLQGLMHPRGNWSAPEEGGRPWTASQKKTAERLLAFIRELGTAHPREVDAEFPQGRVRNYWGGTSNATTHLLDEMHYRGLLRVARREAGIRVYAAHEHGLGPADEAEREARLDAMADVAVGIYAPLDSAGLRFLLRRLRLAAPQWRDELKATLKRAKERLSTATVDGVDWYWPGGEKVTGWEPEEMVRLLTPFDPVVWDRGRFKALWGWEYRFEAYTPVAKRKLGYYALPLLWRDRVVGWGNVSVTDGEFHCEIGFVGGEPRERAFQRELEAELDRMRTFLGVAI